MSQRICSNCNVMPPAFVCFCKEVMICKSCISKHLLDDPEADHKPKSIDAEDIDLLMGSPSKVKVEPLSDEQMEQKLNEKRTLLQSDLELLHLFQHESLMNLQLLRQQWNLEVERVADELATSISSKALSMSEYIKQKLDHLDDQGSPPACAEMQGEDSLLHLKMQVKDLDLAELLRRTVDLSLAFKPQDAREAFIYKFFGGTNIIGVFDPRTETIIDHLSVSLKFYHNSCYCISPQGDVFVTGGSLTGKSRNDFIIFSPQTNSIKEASPMQISRRSHTSLFHLKHCYVFGGLVDEERTSLCERYSELTEKWESIGQMKERRAYLGCCEFRGKLYVGGGAACSSVDVLDIDTMAFQLVVINRLEVEDFCSLMPCGDTILIFHGNFRGEVSQWNPATNQVSDITEMCYGNSWSCCAPLVFEKTVYLLRSDSVFRYNLETGANAYVLRVAKTFKKRLGGDE